MSGTSRTARREERKIAVHKFSLFERKDTCGNPLARHQPKEKKDQAYLEKGVLNLFQGNFRGGGSHLSITTPGKT